MRETLPDTNLPDTPATQMQALIDQASQTIAVQRERIAHLEAIINRVPTLSTIGEVILGYERRQNEVQAQMTEMQSRLNVLVPFVEDLKRISIADATELDTLRAENAILHEMFETPMARQGYYKGVKVLIIMSRPVTMDPLVYRAQYLEGPSVGTNLQLAHTDIEFIDPVRVVTEGYVKDLLDRIAALEGRAAVEGES